MAGVVEPACRQAGRQAGRLADTLDLGSSNKNKIFIYEFVDFQMINCIK